MYGLFDFAYFRRLLEIDRLEFTYGMATLGGVLILGILEGVALGVLLALTVLIRQVSRPATAVLGRLPGTNDYRDTAVHRSAEPIPGLLIFRFDAPVIFANAGYFADEVQRLIGDAKTPIRQVLVPAQQINHLDSTGADQLVKLAAELGVKGIAFSFAEVKNALRVAMRRTGLEGKIGADHYYKSIDDGVRMFLQRQQKNAEVAQALSRNPRPMRLTYEVSGVQAPAPTEKRGNMFGLKGLLPTAVMRSSLAAALAMLMPWQVQR